MNYEMQEGLYKPGPDLIVVAGEPISVRLTALPFIAVGLFFMAFPFMVSEGTQMSFWPRLLFCGFGALGFLAGLQVYLLSDCGAPVRKPSVDEITALAGNQKVHSSIADSRCRADQQKNAFRTIGIVLAMIIIYPFAGWGIAAMEKQSEKIQAGAPSTEMSERLHRMGADKLPVSEPILFVAAPEPGRQNMAKLSLTAFGIVWMIFSCSAAGSLVFSFRRGSKCGALFAMIFLSPFVLIGLWLLTLPYLLYKEDLHTIYAITASRAVEFKADTMHQIVRFDDSRFGPVEQKPYSDSRSDLMFYASDPESSRVCDGFWGIENADLAKAILEEKMQVR